MISFTADAFFRLVARYNADLWPAVAAGTVLALAVIVVAATGRGGGRPVAAILALLWLWTGGVFLGRYLSGLFFAAPLPAALFVLQAGLIAWVGVFRAGLAFRFRPSARGWAGAVLIAAAVLVHPLTAAASDFGWADIRGPATAPAPLTLLTLGLLLWAEGRVPVILLVVPALWSLAWGAIAWELRIAEDLALPAAAVVACVLTFLANRNRTGPP